jgi:phage terminase large subunit
MSTYAIDRLRAEVDELLARHNETRDVADFARYRGRPLDFMREELSFIPYSKQIEIIESFLANKRTVVRGAHGAGKDAVLAAIGMYAAYVEGMLVLVISATERQLLGQLWREIGARFSPRLPGELYTADLRIGGEKRIIAMTSGSTSNLTGWHDAHGVCILITESQSEQVGEAAFDAAIANAVDDASRIVVVGNPVKAQGRFFEVSHKSTWHAIAISAFDHPNVREGRVVIPGGPSPSWPAEMAAEFGTASPWYISRVLGEFPTEGSLDSLIKASWLEPAYERWEKGGLWGKEAPCVGLDVARSFDRDESVAAVTQGARLHRLVTWRSRNLVETADRAITVAIEARDEWILASASASPYALLGRFERQCALHIDSPGIGSGVVDECRRQKRAVTEYWGWRPSVDPERLLNLRSDVYWNLRRLLETGQAQLPRDQKLHEEMLAIEWGEDSKGRIQIASKDLIRAALGRSPDRLDATTIALNVSAPLPAKNRGVWGTSKHSLFKTRG